MKNWMSLTHFSNHHLLCVRLATQTVHFRQGALLSCQWWACSLLLDVHRHWERNDESHALFKSWSSVCSFGHTDCTCQARRVVFFVFCRLLLRLVFSWAAAGQMFCCFSCRKGGRCEGVSPLLPRLVVAATRYCRNPLLPQPILT